MLTLAAVVFDAGLGANCAADAPEFAPLVDWAGALHKGVRVTQSIKRCVR